MKLVKLLNFTLGFGTQFLQYVKTLKHCLQTLLFNLISRVLYSTRNSYSWNFLFLLYVFMTIQFHCGKHFFLPMLLLIKLHVIMTVNCTVYLLALYLFSLSSYLHVWLLTIIILITSVILSLLTALHITTTYCTPHSSLDFLFLWTSTKVFCVGVFFLGVVLNKVLWILNIQVLFSNNATGSKASDDTLLKNVIILLKVNLIISYLCQLNNTLN